jgi:chemotaxis protein histidine kinase CheA
MTDPLAGLRTRFLETTATRLSEMQALLASIAGEEPAPQVLTDLARHFHALAGLGTTYGFPEVSVIGDEGEELLWTLVRGRGTFDAAAAKRLRELVERLEHALRKG